MWETLGLDSKSVWYDGKSNGVHALGLDFADSFFLVRDNVSMGMYREGICGGFIEDNSDGYNSAEYIRGWLKSGEIDSFHSFLHYPRKQIKPILEDFYNWCEREGIVKPFVWINHSMGVTPSGLSPKCFRPNRLKRLIHQCARGFVSLSPSQMRRSISDALSWYAGATPSSKYYINDILAANGLRYVWLNSNDALPNRIVLPEQLYGDRSSILDVVTMDDGVKYYRFFRCYGKTQDSRPGMGYCLRQSDDTCDTSSLFTKDNLDELCQKEGTCILYTHWTLARSFPISDTTISHFNLVKQYRDAGRLWVTSLSKILEWSRLRTFLKYSIHVDKHSIFVDIEGIDDPVCGFNDVAVDDLLGLSFRVVSGRKLVKIAIAGKLIDSESYKFHGSICRITSKDEV